MVFYKSKDFNYFLKCRVNSMLAHDGDSGAGQLHCVIEITLSN